MLKLNSIRPKIKHYLEEIFFMNGELIQDDLRLLEIILNKAENLEEVSKEETDYLVSFPDRLMFGDKCHLNTIYRAFYLTGTQESLPYLNAINDLMNALKSRNQVEAKKLVSYLDSLHEIYLGKKQTTCFIQDDVLRLISDIVSTEEKFQKLGTQVDDLSVHLLLERDRVWQKFEYENDGLIGLSSDIIKAFKELDSPKTSN